MESDQDDEEILLVNPDEPQLPGDGSNVNTVSVKFAQAHRATLESKKFCIYDNKFLQITSFRKNIKQQYWINLAYINSRADRKFIMNKLWLWLFLLFLCLAGITYSITMPEPLAIISDYKYSIVILNLTLAFMALVTLFGKARSVVYLRSSTGAVPMAELLYNNPNKNSFKQFMNKISDCIQRAKEQSGFDVSQLLAGELKEHRRLRDEGVLSHENYDKAKEIIFSLHSSPVITEKILPQ